MTALVIVRLAPLAAALLIVVFGHRFLARGGWLAVLGTFFAAAALPFFYGAHIATGIDWFCLGPWHFTLSLHLNGLGWWLAVLVAWVSLAVNVYAVRYMEPENGRARFHAWVAFFVASMLTLVLAGSLLLLFLAWEGVGLASFALIAQRHRKAEARRAAVKAFLMTRLGDFGLLLGWLLVLHLIGTTDIVALLATAQAGHLPDWAPLLLAMLFLAAALGKSAQLPLTAWLPEAMIGPTPVSALIHSATMVAAGVYLILRLFPLFQAAPPALDVVLWIGGVTAMFAAIAATAQTDLKRVLAWSTVSQLGEMLIALGLGAPIATALHLTTHAVFKACLFLGAGVVERAAGSHEFAQLGGLYRCMPWTTAAFVIAALTLAGLPPFSGYWSEKHILEAAVTKQPGWAIVLLVLITLAGVYIGRAAMATFGLWRKTEQSAKVQISWIMLAPLGALAAAAAAFGWLVEQPVASVLPWPTLTHSGRWWWTAGAIAASITGLSLGAWRVRRRPVPAFGTWARALGQTVHSVTAMVSRTIRSASMACGTLEGGFDQFAYSIAKTALAMAEGTRIGEDRIIWIGNDRLAYTLNQAGARLRLLEGGKVSLYAASVFVWVLCASLMIALLTCLIPVS